MPPSPPAPGPPPSSRTPVSLMLPTSHPRGIALASPSGVFRGPMNLMGLHWLLLASALLIGPWTSPGYRHRGWPLRHSGCCSLHSPQARPWAWPNLRPLLGTPAPKAQAAPGSVTTCFMLSQEGPTAEVLRPQHDAEVDEAALLVPNHTTALSLECRAHLTGMVGLGGRGLQVPATASDLVHSFVLWLAPESMFSNGQFSLGCLAVPPCTPASTGHPQPQGKGTPTLPGEFPVSQMRKRKVGGAVPRSPAL